MKRLVPISTHSSTGAPVLSPVLIVLIGLPGGYGVCLGVEALMGAGAQFILLFLAHTHGE